MIIDLSHATFIGKGKNKRCFISPQDPSLCIKISNQGSNPKELRKEIREFKRLSNKQIHHSPYLVIPKFYGSVETSLGTGYVFERIVNEEGGTCLTLKQHIISGAIPSADREEILSHLYKEIHDSAAIISELNSDNVLILNDSPLKFALVDGFGEGSSIRLTEIHPYFARQKLKRKFVPFKKEVLNLST